MFRKSQKNHKKVESLIFIISAFCIAVLLVTNIPLTQLAIAADDGTTNLNQTELLPKGNPKLDSALNRLVSEVEIPTLAPFLAESVPEIAENTVRVIVEAVTGQAEEITSTIGGSVNFEARYGDLLQVVVPISQLNVLAEMPNVRFVRTPGKPLPAVVTSEGVAAINADEWLGASYNGTGIKIGILDVGFSGYTDRQTEGELPSSINTWWAPSIGDAGTNVHGTACAEIVYDIAPDATYYFANFATEVEYGNAVEWLIDQGIDVISCSVGWPTGGPGDGTGTFCQVVDFAQANGALWAQSIGNQAERHWQGDFSNPDADLFHNFSGDDEGNTISVTNGQMVVAALKWNDVWSSSVNDYDLLLYDTNNNLVALSANIQDGDDDPWEALAYTANYTGNYHIAIGALGSPATVNFHLYSYSHDLEYQTAGGSVVVPADSFSAVAVGAVDYSTPTGLESFSSHGPTDDGRVKPDLVATDNVSTVSYNPSGFTGTSAAAPHVAGAAALVKERYSSYTPDQIQSFLEGRAVDLGSAGKDNLYGSGRLYLQLSTLEVVTNEATDISADSATIHGNLTSLGGYGSANVSFEWGTDLGDYTAETNPQLMTNTGNFSANLTGLDLNTTYYFRAKAETDLTTFGTEKSFTIEVEASTGLLSYWCFDEGSGNLTQDLTGGNDGTVMGANWTNGKAGNALSFDGVNDYVFVPHDSSLNFDGDGTVELWANPSGNGVLVWKRFYSGSTGWTLYNTFTDMIIGYVNDYAVYVQTRVTLGQWQHIVFLYENGAMKLFINGALNATATVPQGFDATGSNLYIGCQEGSLNYFSGAIDEVAIWNRALTTGEIQQHYQNGLAGLGYMDKSKTNLLRTFTVAVNGSGNTSPAVGSHEYSTNSMVNITAAPSTNWEFVNWIGDVADANSATTNVTLDTDKTVTANFNRINSVLRMTTNGIGNVTPAVGSYTYPVGTTVNLTAANTTNWEFVNWEGDVSDNISVSTNVTLNWDKTITANFNRIAATLTMAKSGGGSVTPAVGDHTCAVGATVNITATPSSGWRFVNWTGDVADASLSSTTVTISTDKTIMANFSEITAISGQIAFTSDLEGPAETKIYTMNQDGSSQTKLTGPITIGGFAARDYYPSCSPDGSWIAFYSGRGGNWDIYKVDRTDATIIRLTTDANTDSQPAWSPDGNKIAFVSDRDGNREIYVMNTDGSNQIRLTNNAGDDMEPRWLPDGTIAYRSSVSVYLMNSDGTNKRIFTGPKGVWSPDGTKIAFMSSNDIYVADVDGSNQLQLTNTTVARELYPAWSPDGDKIVFTTNRDGNYEIYVMNSDGKSQTRLTNNTVKDLHSSWAAFNSTLTPTPPPLSGGGGGVAGLTGLSHVTTMEGRLLEDVTAMSGDKKVALFMPKNTIIKNRVGSLLPSIRIQEEKEPPAPPEDSGIIGLCYDIGPDGATFDPPVTLNLEYDASGLPQGVGEGNLFIATWDKANGQWIKLESIVDSENDVISAKAAHLCYFTIMAGTRPAEFNTSNLSVIPSEIYPGENADISVMVTNNGDLTGSYESILKINGKVKEKREITIAGEDNVTTDFVVTGGTIGKYNIEIGGLEATFNVVPAPAEFTVSSLDIFPDEVSSEEEVNITVTVINASESEGSYEVELKINGNIVDTKEVLLAGRTNQQVVFTTVLGTPGKKIVEINGLVGGLIVTGEVSPPEQIPLPSEDSEPIIETPTEPTPSVTTSTLPVEAPSIKWWLVIVITTGCIALIALLLYFTWWRRRRTLE